jgi:hypothetical protein
VIVGHCEKLAGPLWEHKVGNRSWFGIENGNLSLIGIPAEGGKRNGEGMYMGVPHSQPDYMNHQQGFSLLVYSNGHWHPQTIRIVKGQAFYNGKLYDSDMMKFLDGIKLMINRMVFSHYKYGNMGDKYPHSAKSIDSADKRIAMYKESGNTENLLDAANFCVIEHVLPSHEMHHFKAQGSHESPGIVWRED